MARDIYGITGKDAKIMVQTFWGRGEEYEALLTYDSNGLIRCRGFCVGISSLRSKQAEVVQQIATDKGSPAVR